METKPNIKFKVTFKESYMPHEVTRFCEVPSRQEVVRIYGLDGDDIDYYRIEECK